MITSPCKVDPLTLHFYIEKMGFTEAVLTCTHNVCFEQKNKKNIKTFNMKITIFTAFKNRSILHRHVCVM